MDALARRGVRLTSYYGQPSCSPSRATLLTGKFAHRIGFQDTEIVTTSNFSIPLGEKLLSHRLRAAGYATCVRDVGANHQPPTTHHQPPTHQTTNPPTHQTTNPPTAQQQVARSTQHIENSKQPAPSDGT